MERRWFCAGVAMALAACGPARLGRKVVGILAGGDAKDLQVLLRDVGARHGIELEIETRIGSPSDARWMVRKLVQDKVDLIITLGTPFAIVAKEASSTIPIVFVVLADPVEVGLASELALPSGNATGIYTLTTELAAKRVELLHEAAPSAVRLGILPSTGLVVPSELESTRRAIATLRLTAVDIDIQAPQYLPGALDGALKQRIDGLCLLTAPPILMSLQRIVEFAVENRLPSVAGYSGFARRGGLISLSADNREVLRRVAELSGKILTGATPASIPVERSQRFEVAVNLRTARSIGLSVPQSVRLIADHLID